MFLTDQEIAEHKIDVKAWAGAMQVAGRAPGAPAFALKGPCTLEVRKRRPGPVAMQTAYHPFTGGESFRLAGVHVDKKHAVQGLGISVQLTPATTDLAATIGGMTMPLDEAIEHFNDLEAFALQFRGAVPAAKTPKATAKAEREENPMWGAW